MIHFQALFLFFIFPVTTTITTTTIAPINILGHCSRHSYHYCKQYHHILVIIPASVRLVPLHSAAFTSVSPPPVTITTPATHLSNHYVAQPHLLKMKVRSRLCNN